MSDRSTIAKVMAEMGKRGGHARAKVMTPEQRRESAIKASKAAAKARTRNAKEEGSKGLTGVYQQVLNCLGTSPRFA